MSPESHLEPLALGDNHRLQGKKVHKVTAVQCKDRGGGWQLVPETLLGPGVRVKHPPMVGQHPPLLLVGCGALAARTPAGCQVIPRDAAAPQEQPSDALGCWQWFGCFLLSALEASAGRGRERPRRAAAASRAAKRSPAGAVKQSLAYL